MATDELGTPEEAARGHRGSPLRRMARRLVAELGRGPGGPAAVRAFALLARQHLLPTSAAAAAVARAVSLRSDATVEIRRRLGGGGRVLLGLDLRYSGCIELLVAPNPASSDAVTAALLVALAQGAELVVDVGANVGLYTYLVAAAAPRTRVIALEPTPALAALVARNVERNGWQSRVVVRAEAAGAARGASTLYIMSDADTENTLDPARVAGREHRTISVAVRPIDELLRDAGARRGRTLLKIDVEGHEQAALDGLHETLAGPGERPDIIIEFLGRAITEERIIERVRGLGLSVYYIGPRGLTPLGETADLAPVHTLGYWNFLLTARPDETVRAVAARAGIAVGGGDRRAH